MATVTFPDDLGGDGLTVTDDANPDTGLAAGGHRLRFVPALNNTVAMARTAADQAAAAKQSETAAAASRSAAKSSETRAANSASAASSSQRASADSAKAAARSADSVDADQIMHKRGSGLANEVGTAATRDVGTDSGELMEVGAFGIGVPGSQIVTDLKKLPKYGTFFQLNGANTEGAPGTSNYYGGIALTRKSGSLINTIWLIPDSTALYTLREMSDGSIESLTYLNNKNAVGSVGDGLPGVIESGENSNGRYIKYADGSLVMTFEGFVVRPDSSQRYLQMRWTYPHAVINPMPFAALEYANSNIPDVADKKIYPAYDKDGVQVAAISKSNSSILFVDVFKTDTSAPYFEENAAAYVFLQVTGKWR